MARTTEGAQLTEQHRQAQLQIRAQALQAYLLVWPLWAGDDSSFGRLLDASVPIVRAHHALSASIAAGYFDAFRSAERAGGASRALTAPSLPEQRIRGTLNFTGRQMTREALLAGQSPQEAMQTALVRTSGTVTRLTLAGGRDSVVQSSLEDEKAGGWARVTDPDPCAFCALLAGRGPVYSADTVDFKAHDHCSCVAEPHYFGSEWPGRGREFHDLYNQATRDARASGELKRGTSNDLLNAFRRAYEKRAPQGAQ